MFCSLGLIMLTRNESFTIDFAFFANSFIGKPESLALEHFSGPREVAFR